MTLHSTKNDISMLLVEDQADTREQLSQMLTAQGYRLLLAENGREGLKLFRSQSPEIILTDIMMPSMSGLEMARLIREEAPGAQIIVMTAFSDTRYLLEAIDIGINQFVIKPIEFNKLLAAIERCIGAIQLEAEALRVKKLEATAILAGGMAHDFNNLLQVILGYICLAKQHAEHGSKVHQLLGVAEKSSGQARELGQRLLTFASGGEVSTHGTHLGRLITTAVEAALKGGNVTLELDLPADIHPAQIDETQMRQVISHLTANALEAMPCGGTLQVAACNLNITEKDGLPLPPGEYVRVTFRDTGKGIPPENMERIFDPYFTTKQMGSQKGMGLGLAICQAIIRKHEGIITAESRPGEGAAFHIYLPVVESFEF